MLLACLIPKDPFGPSQEKGGNKSGRRKQMKKIEARKALVEGRRGILDVEQGGTRVASSQFEIMILEHLATK